MPVAGFIGLLGTGKTLGMTAFSYELYVQKFKIMANYHLTFGEMVNPLDLIGFELKNCVLCIDEAYTVLDSRDNNKAARLLTYFIKQSRKRDVWIFYTSQRLMDVDIRLRQVTERIVYCQKQQNERGKIDFLFTIIESGQVVDEKTLTWKKAEDIFKLYDTNEIIMPVALQNEYTTMDHLKELAEKCPNAQSFIEVVTTENPYILKDTARALYSLIKAEQYLLAETLLNPLKKDI